MVRAVAQPRPSLYPTRSSAGALLGQQLASRGYQACILLGITPEGVEIAAHAAKAMGAQFDVIVASFIKLGANLAPIGAMAESAPAEMDPDFQPGMNLLEKLQAAIDESRARVKQDLVLYRTQRPVKKLEGRTAVIVDGQIVYPWKALAAAKAVEGLGAREVVIATPVAAQPAADRIRARQYPLVCPSVVMEQEGHPSPYGDAGADAPERLKSIMIAHQGILSRADSVGGRLRRHRGRDDHLARAQPFDRLGRRQRFPRIDDLPVDDDGGASFQLLHGPLRAIEHEILLHPGARLVDRRLELLEQVHPGLEIRIHLRGCRFGHCPDRGEIGAQFDERRDDHVELRAHRLGRVSRDFDAFGRDAQQDAGLIPTRGELLTEQGPRAGAGRIETGTRLSHGSHHSLSFSTPTSRTP